MNRINLISTLIQVLIILILVFFLFWSGYMLGKIDGFEICVQQFTPGSVYRVLQ